MADGVIGFWPAASNNADTVTLQTSTGEVKLESLRQQLKKAVGQPSYSLADFIKPTQNSSPLGDGDTNGDYMGAFAVTIHGAKNILTSLLLIMMNTIKYWCKYWLTVL